MAGTVSQTSAVERRNKEPEIRTVWERVLTFILTDSSGADEIKQALNLNGIIRHISAVSGAATGITGTFTLAIDDNADAEIFSASGPAEGATSNWNVDLAVSGTIDIGVNPNDDPTSGTWTIVITLRGI